MRYCSYLIYISLCISIADASWGLQTINLEPQAIVWNIPWKAGTTETIWSYSSTYPSPEIRLKKGESVRVVVKNSLDVETTVHWHGMRVENSMDGVPGITQDPIQPGQTFVYEFTPDIAGTFLYHPHVRTHEQVARGLIGALVIEDESDPPVDRDVAILINDWRLSRRGTTYLDKNFDNRHDEMMNGRIGDIITINGDDGAFTFYRGERVRLRFINATNARIISFKIPAVLLPQLIARDAYAIPPKNPEVLTLGPGMRADIIVDIPDKKKTWTILDLSTPKKLSLMTIHTKVAPKAMELQVHNPIPLPSQARVWPTPNLEQATVINMPLTFNGMNGMMGSGRTAHFWSIRGQSNTEQEITDGVSPLLNLTQGKSYIFNIYNNNNRAHPMHLHGHVFQVLDSKGRSGDIPDYRDTVLINGHETIQIAFVAEANGNWAWHCHILEHAASGMMSYIKNN